jgi:transporter family protein
MSSTSQSDGVPVVTLSGFLIGGAIPAICLELGAVFMRASLGAGASIPLNLAVVGSVVALLGWAAFIWTGGTTLSLRPVLLAAAMGTTWILAIACMAYGSPSSHR